jgi:VanZ family protein
MASEGRSPALRDVGIDTLGAFAGCLATLMVRQMALLELRHEAFFRERRQGRLRRDSE